MSSRQYNNIIVNIAKTRLHLQNKMSIDLRQLNETKLVRK